MEVKQSTLAKSLQITETPASIEAPVIIPEANRNDVVITPTVVENANPVIEKKEVVAPVITPEAQGTTPLKREDEIIAFDFPEDEINTPAAVLKTTTSWKDLVKDVAPEELEEFLGDDDFIKGMRKHIKNGGSPLDYINAKGVNWENISDDAILKSELRKEFPEATPTQIERLFNKKYNQTETAEEEDKEDGLLLMKSDARKVRGQKVEEQKRFQIPEAKQITPNQQPQIDEKKQAELKKEFDFIANHDATKNLFQSKRVAIEIGDGEKLNMGIKNPQALYDIWFKPGTLEKFTRTPQGEPDVQKLQEAALFLANPTQYKKLIFNAGKEAGTNTIVDEGRNAGLQGAVILMNANATSFDEAIKAGVKQSTIGKFATQ